MEGLDPHFRPDVLEMTRLEGRNSEFCEIGFDPRSAFNTVPNVVNSESIIFVDSNVGSRMMEAIALPRDRHAMFHSEETTLEFANRLCGTLALVSH